MRCDYNECVNVLCPILLKARSFKIIFLFFGYCINCVGKDSWLRRFGIDPSDHIKGNLRLVRA